MLENVSWVWKEQDVYNANLPVNFVFKEVPTTVLHFCVDFRASAYKHVDVKQACKCNKHVVQVSIIASHLQMEVGLSERRVVF